MFGMGEFLMQMGTMMGSLMFVSTMIGQFIPRQISDYITMCVQRLLAFTNPYIEITFDEYTSGKEFDYMKVSKLYTTIEAYLSPRSSKIARRLKAQTGKGNKNFVLCMDDYQEIIDVFQGAKIWWYLGKTVPRTQSICYYPVSGDRRHLVLKLHRKHRDLIAGPYLDHVIKEGKVNMLRNQQRKLYSNNPSRGYYEYEKKLWSHVVFDHPLKFNHLAMDPVKKKEIVDDLITFSTSKDYYMEVGKAWKRGYLLYGPPGTGKSSMIAAMANLLNYDIYDLELTAVKDNTELRRLLTDTTNKSIIVIEDIDCSLELTGKRKNKKKEEDGEEEDPIRAMAHKEEEDNKDSKVTLSGLLNFIDGIWSNCGGERIIVFTTNHIEKLDPALIRRGRMDKHIEFSYCNFEGFKVLAKNYLHIESHDLFETIRSLLDENQMTPADVAENLMPKTKDSDSEVCLKRLIQALEKAKENKKFKDKAKEDKKLKAEAEEREKLEAEAEEDTKLEAEAEEDTKLEADAKEEEEKEKKEDVPAA